ncbi:MAG: hypothetical protein M3256_04920 [Actinomycetota bacterium]|nr:hypothetical protein [Actinomycetota bacterium]
MKLAAPASHCLNTCFERPSAVSNTQHRVHSPGPEVVDVLLTAARSAHGLAGVGQQLHHLFADPAGGPVARTD